MKICIVGSGNMTHAMVEYFLEVKYEIVMLNIDLGMAHNVLKDRPGTRAVHWKETSEKILDECVAEGDIVISMVPAFLHGVVGNSCIRNGKNMLNCSYEASCVKELHQTATEAGTFILSELGECPGLDHFATTLLIEELRSKCYDIMNVDSLCSGIPAHQSNNNPFFYKFNWYPAGMMKSAQTEASFLENGKIVVVPGHQLFKYYRFVDIDSIGTFECYPNRRIDKYVKAYGLEKIEGLTFWRGLLRHSGYCGNMEKMVALRLFDSEIFGEYGGKRYLDFMNQVAGIDASTNDVNVTKRALAKFLQIKFDDDFIRRLDWLGMFSTKIIPGKIRQSNSEVCMERMLDRLKYEKDDVDLVICHISITAKKDEKLEVHSLTLNAIGEKFGFSAMTKAVGYCAAVTAKLILEGKIDISKIKGCLIPPNWKELAPLALEELAKCGFEFKRNVKLVIGE